jgi:hypothetical protein
MALGLIQPERKKEREKAKDISWVGLTVLMYAGCGTCRSSKF